MGLVKQSLVESLVFKSLATNGEKKKNLYQRIHISLITKKINKKGLMTNSKLLFLFNHMYAYFLLFWSAKICNFLLFFFFSFN